MFVARDRVDRALRLKVPPNADSDVGFGDEVLRFRAKPVGKQMGPYLVADRKGKSVILNTGDRLLPAFIDKVKLYWEPIPPELNAIGNVLDVLPQNVDRDADRLDEILKNLDRSLPNGDEQLLPSLTASQLDEVFRHDENSYQSLNTISTDEFVVKIVKPDDPRSQMEDFQEAQKAEAAGLKARKI